MEIKLLLLVFIFVLTAEAVQENDGGKNMGQRIFDGLQDTLLHLLTPQLSLTKDETYEPLNQRQEKEIDAVRQKFQSLKLQHLDAKMKGVTYDPDASEYFKFIPNYLETLTIGKPYKIDIPCYQDATVTAKAKVDPSDNPIDVVFELHEPSSLLCRAAFVIATDTEAFVKEFWTSGTHSVSFSHPTTDAEQWDLNRGPRLFVFPTDLETALGSLASTLLLFEPTLTQGVAWPFDEWNLDFLRDMAGIEMPQRVFNGSDEDTSYIPDPSLVKSGDTFDILRLDGLDPMIAWAMGSATGHQAVAMWKEDELFICESNAKTGYWHINGIQCNLYEDWMQYGKNADYNTVWVQLSEENAATFDESKAWAYIDEHMGIDYGWQNVIMGWLDVNDGNTICVDTDKTWCLQPQHHLELVFSIAERISKDAAKLFVPAMMQRAGVSNFDSPLVEAYYKAYKDGLDYTNLHNMVELDTYQYPTLKYDEPVISDVSICHVFVCKVFKASGIFGELENEFNCGDLSVNDMYRLNIYNQNNENRPNDCKERDPENPLCQVLGKYSLRLDTQPGIPPRYNYVQLYPNFGSQCPSEAPDYLAPPDC